MVHLKLLLNLEEYVFSVNKVIISLERHGEERLYYIIMGNISAIHNL